MNLFPQSFITRHQAKLLFLVVWGHVTILNLFYVTYAGPIFFWQESLQVYTLFIHLTVACLTLACYFLLIYISSRFSAHKAEKLLNSTVNSTKESSY